MFFWHFSHVSNSYIMCFSPLGGCTGGLILLMPHLISLPALKTPLSQLPRRRSFQDGWCVVQVLLVNQEGHWQGTWSLESNGAVLPGSVTSGTPVLVRVRTTKQKLLSVFQSIRIITQRCGSLYDCWKDWRNKSQGKPLLALRVTAGFQRLRNLFQLFRKGISGHCPQWLQLPAASRRAISRKTPGGSLKKKVISVDIYRSTCWCLFVTFGILRISISLVEPKLNPKSCCQGNPGNV